MLNTRITIILFVLALTACTGPAVQQPQPRVVEREIAKPIPSPREISHPATDTAEDSGQTVTAGNQTVPVDAGHEDVWERIHSQFSMDRHTGRASVRARLAWYARHQGYLDRVAERARPYLYHIVERLEARNMPLELALLPIVESAFHPFAYSRSHASGIWQFIPATGKRFGLKQNWWYDGRRDIVAATDAALDYLEELHEEFNGNWLHALASYNTGERNVARAIIRNKGKGKPTDFWSLRLPRETRGYVPSLLAVAELLANAREHGVTWQSIANRPYFDVVALDKQIDLATAANLAGMSMDEIYTLNPGFNRWATDPDGPHRLLIPVEKSSQFTSALQVLPESERISWKRHVIKRGESLGLIARKYHSSVSALKQTNKLRSNLIREGHSLLIPSSSKPLAHYTLSQDARRYRGLKKSPDGKAHQYTVRRGDTLWDIGRQYGVSIRELCAWNGISPKSIIRPGNTLTLYLSSEQQNTAKAIPVDYEKTEDRSYTVRKGDSLWLIARRFNTSVKELQRLNKLDKNNFLRPGQRLIIEKSKEALTGV